MVEGPGVDIVADLETEQVGQFAHIECMSVLEHCKRPWAMCANLEYSLMPGGTIYIAVPFIWRVHGYPDDYWRFTVSGVKALFTKITWTQAEYSHRTLCKAEDIPSVRSADDWPCFARTEVLMFGYKEAG
jgi:2-polyprenyl-3-methyl-5-hydroxy-6-metoxy-1,4-benzoquinol methylase